MTTRKCGCCDHKLPKVLMQIGRNREDWLMQQCEECGEDLCTDCEVTHDNKIVCADCYQTVAIRKP